MTGAPLLPATAPAQPLIGFGSVRHLRLRPARNAFSYPTYFLLLPLRSMRAQTGGSATLAHNRRAALSFFDIDHGDGRSPQDGGALGWLDQTLHSAGIHDATGEVWLQCYPRVFGFAFKPVSFWYCHRASDDCHGALRAIVVEVNNTFGERHCYLLDQPTFGAELRADKAFHVSPFLRIEGQYRFRFMRVQRQGAEMVVARIDYDDAQGPVLQTSVSGNLQPLSPNLVRRALWRYPAMTIGVVFHIHLQAAKLWFKRVRFVPKPAPPAQSLSQTPLPSIPLRQP